ncbi:MAG TPA: hypothetical protein VK472_03550 [Allosphingosinicella sp.]|nr:hypothetical protein [Allosphingosinicella sp.]
MASVPIAQEAGPAPIHGSLSDPAGAIGGPRFDMLFFWGAPILASVLVWAWVLIARSMPTAAGQGAVTALVYGVAVLTFAHLVAVVPRAYLNRDVFASNRNRLVIVPLLLVAALLLSPALLVCAAVLAMLWDVHHSAMQTFGIGRIYDMKAGNGPHILRSTDLRLNWALYVGPIAAGASLLAHAESFSSFARLDWTLLATSPGIVASHVEAIRYAAIAAWAVTLGWAVRDYRAAAAAGYAMPVHKAALLGSTGFVSILAWGFAPPFMAFAIINLFHAVQYFALVWLKEGDRISTVLSRGGNARRIALPAFLLSCGGFGILYAAIDEKSVLIAPFIACSLLHFWFDSFVWSVRKKQV